MSNIPVPMIHGANDSAKIQNIISYITQLADTLSRELNSIGLPNLSQELREKIDGAISQHQDLSEYATKAYAEKYTDKTDSARKTWVESNFLTESETKEYVDEKISAINETLSSINDEISKINDEIEKINGEYGEIYYIKLRLSNLENPL